MAKTVALTEASTPYVCFVLVGMVKLTIWFLIPLATQSMLSETALEMRGLEMLPDEWYLLLVTESVIKAEPEELGVKVMEAGGKSDRASVGVAGAAMLCSAPGTKADAADVIRNSV